MSEEISITDRAAENPGASREGDTRTRLARRVVEGGFEYKTGIDSSESEDQVFENTGARILLDSRSILRLNGTELDYTSGLMPSGFVKKNPNVRETCGCGTSFSA